MYQIPEMLADKVSDRLWRSWLCIRQPTSNRLPSISLDKYEQAKEQERKVNPGIVIGRSVINAGTEWLVPPTVQYGHLAQS
jgi:hypothetical protein